MRTRSMLSVLTVLAAITVGGLAQQPATPKPAATAATPAVPVERKDPVLEVASAEIGRALFLRCLCAENNLSFDAEGRLQTAANGAAVKTTDWTLAGVNVLKVDRRAASANGAAGNGAGSIEFEGVRVAIRYAADRHEFDRHPQATEKVKIVIADPGNAAAFERALQRVFALGIDQALQHAMPEYWQHYFNPSLAWPKDELTDAKMLPPTPPLPAGAVQAQVTHKAEAGSTTEADHDRVAGMVTLRMFVTAEGNIRRVSIAQPLGYGLDERAVQASEKLRFTPATMSGKPVNSYVVLREEFVVAPAAK